jgi:hypothetical protein
MDGRLQGYKLATRNSGSVSYLYVIYLGIFFLFTGISIGIITTNEDNNFCCAV